MVIILLVLSILFSLAAAWLALRLIPLSGSRLAWSLIAAAFALRALRLPLQLFYYLDPHTNYQLVIADELVGLAISVLGAAGTYCIGPLFIAFRRAEEDREIYLHSISHDLRSPLTVIQGHAELLCRDLCKPPSAQAESVRAILHASARLTAMTADLVDSARWQGGTLVLEWEEMDLPIFLQALFQRDFLDDDRQRLLAEIPPSLPSVAADRERLERILLNLLGNALKYSPADQPVRLRVADLGREIRFCIDDRGPGIAEEDLPWLFERYFRSEEGKKRRGIGLGLHISKILVEAHGGRIWVESTPGQGSTFCFTLPIRAITTAAHATGGDKCLTNPEP
jgi:signal transduction histidine kinase